jgi:hypothetical protein
VEAIVDWEPKHEVLSALLVLKMTATQRSLWLSRCAMFPDALGALASGVHAPAMIAVWEKEYAVSSALLVIPAIAKRFVLMLWRPAIM